MFARHVNKLDDHIIEFFVVLEFEVRFDALVPPMPDVHRLLNTVTRNILDVAVSHQRIDLAETHEISLSMIKNLVPRNVRQPT